MPVARKKVDKERRALLEDRRASGLNVKKLIRGYRQKETSIAGRIAEFLLYVSRTRGWAGKFLLYEEVAQAVNNLGKRPMRNSLQVKTIRGAISSASIIALRKYKHGIVPLPGVGMRLTFNDYDKSENLFLKKVRQVETAIVRVNEVRESIDRDKAAKEAKREKDPDDREAKIKTVEAVSEFDNAQPQLAGPKTRKALTAAGDARDAVKAANEEK